MDKNWQASSSSTRLLVCQRILDFDVSVPLGGSFSKKFWVFPNFWAPLYIFFFIKLSPIQKPDSCGSSDSMRSGRVEWIGEQQNRLGRFYGISPHNVSQRIFLLFHFVFFLKLYRTFFNSSLRLQSSVRKCYFGKFSLQLRTLIFIPKPSNFLWQLPGSSGLLSCNFPRFLQILLLLN